jgi:MFS transporter, ACDE family, multidrug resistance protein
MLLIYSITATGITANTLITPAIPDILNGLHAPRSLAGIVIASAAFPSIFMAPAIGILADRYGRRALLVPCLVLFGVAGGLAAFSPNIWVLAVLRLFQGAGSAGLINLAIVLIGDNWDGLERARRVGRNAACLTICVAIFPILGGTITDLFGWRGTFYLYPLAIVTAVVVARQLPRSTRRPGRVSDQLREAAPYIRSAPMIGTIVTAVLIFILIFGVLLTVMPLYAEDRFGMDAAARGILLSLPAVTSTIGALGMARIHRWFGRRRVLIGAPALYAVALAIIATADTVTPLGIGVLIFGLADGLLIPGLQDLAAGLAPASSRGIAVAMWVGSARTGQTIGPLAAAAMYDAAGAEPTFWTGAVIAGLLTVGLAAGSRSVRPSARAVEASEVPPLAPEG